MSLWTHKNIEALIFMNDHCDPHVTFVCRADDWKARMRFSMVKSDIKLIDVKPLKNRPATSLLNRLANQLDARLDDCRMEWWLTKGGELCIDNKDVERIGNGRVLLDGIAPTGRIIAKSGKYVPKPSGSGHHVTASIKWADGTITHNEVVE
jgi:hypothetical protein